MTPPDMAFRMIDLGGDTNGIGSMVFTGRRSGARSHRGAGHRIGRRVSSSGGGSVPFGFTVASGGALLPHPAQQPAIGRAKALRDQ